MTLMYLSWCTVFDQYEIGILFLCMDSDDAAVCGFPHNNVYLVYLIVSESVLVVVICYFVDWMCLS